MACVSCLWLFTGDRLFIEGMRAPCRGVPVGRYTRAEAMAAYWGIGTYWGKAQSNNKKGHLIGHIRDIGHDPAQATTRLYATHEAQPYHNDSSDQVGV